MKIKFDDIENAFLYVSMTPMFGNQAILSKETGEIFYISETGDSDDLPDDIDESDNYIEIPHKNELDLGNNLVFRFVSEHLSEEYNRVEQIFRKKGAYSRYKDLLERKGLLDQWHKFENEAQSKALREWCKENNIDLID
jgi:hemerythrin-like domain-containing protein